MKKPTKFIISVDVRLFDKRVLFEMSGSYRPRSSGWQKRGRLTVCSSGVDGDQEDRKKRKENKKIIKIIKKKLLHAKTTSCTEFIIFVYGLF